ncbi:MAG: hypothetical protein GY757_57055, partial [bacterium]|nr:hypothetical protein [bacterium]
SDILLTGAKKRNLSRSFPGENLMPVVTKRKNGGFTVAWTLFRQGNAQLCIYDSNADLSELIPIEDFKSAYTLDTVYFDGDPFLIVFMGNNSDNTEVFYYNLLNDSLVNVTQTPYCEQHAEVDDNKKNFTVVTDSIYKINHYEVSKPGLNIALTASHDIVYPGPTELPVLSGNARNTVVGF